MKGFVMTVRRTLATSVVALSISMTGAPLWAEVSPQQVWDDWQTYFEGLGYQVEASESQSGSDLVISDMTMSIDVPAEGASAGMTISELVLADNGDGTVTVSFPASMPLRMTGRDDEGQEVQTVLDLTSEGLVMTVAGDPDDLTYSYAAARLTMALDEIVANGDPLEIGDASMTVANLAGTTRMTMGALRDTTQDFTAGPVTYDLDVTDPEAGGRMVAKGGYESIGFKGDAKIPLEASGSDMAAMLKDGFALDGGFTFAAGSSEFSFEEDGQTLEGRTSSRGGALDVDMSGERLHYGGKAEGMQINMQTSDLPFPVEFSTETFGLDLMFPVLESEEAQDFAASFTLSDFTMSEMIWSMFDPAQQLPRDPATIAFDLAGKARLFFDLLDPEQAEAMGESGATPAELETLALNALTVRLAGAELTGEGDFTFDNTDLETFDGMPAPTGALDLRLVGGNALLDKLVAMGLVPQDQASGMRMMMGLFARPGGGEDELVSTIEINEEGHVLANGQRIQ